ncbi:glycosyltransferase [Arthrobacter sp. SAFR-014]|uniref:glycosyltransferase n=1 Tax=unclassified Arthrobacter TaxID=235627 RepID=UPI003F7C4196
MKICIVIPSLSGGGAEFVAKEWSKWLTSVGDIVTLVVTHSKTTDVAPSGVNVVEFSGGNPVAHVREMRRLVRKERFDFVIGLLPYFNLLAILGVLPRIGKRPRVLISGRNVEVPFPHVHGKSVAVTRLISKLLYPLVDGYIAISHPVAAEAGALYRIPAHKMRVVPNPSTAKVLEWASRLEGSGAISEAALLEEAATGPLNIIVPARLVEQKRPQIALEAARHLVDEGHQVVLHFYGDGPLREIIQRTADTLGVKVEFHGWVENWFAECPRTGVVVLTSLAEGFGNVLVEAAAVGLPSVASSRCLGSADAIVPGITGEFASGDGPADYAEAIKKAALIQISDQQLEGWLARFSPATSGSHLRSYLTSLD